MTSVAWAETLNIVDRWSAVGITQAATTGPLHIDWHPTGVPYVSARTDEDVAFGAGLVQAHLRLGQMELTRRIATGRLAEGLGAFLIKVDRSLRTLDFAAAGRAAERGLHPASRAYLASFVAGINHYQAAITGTRWIPKEYGTMRADIEPWTIADVLTLTRLYALDMSWASYLQLYIAAAAGNTGFKDLFLQMGLSSPVSFRSPGWDRLTPFLHHISKTGSNAIAVAGSRSASGSGLLANDPHLGLFAPNFWVVMALATPDWATIGLSVVGAPATIAGRNDTIAWGATSMRGISSNIYALDTSDAAKLKRKVERLSVRLWPDKRSYVRWSEYGPIISDAPMLPSSSKPLALDWVGHQPSDETLTFMQIGRAQSFLQFKQAFKTYAVSAQNMVYADKQGHIGQVMAYRMPLLAQPMAITTVIKSVEQRPVAYVRPDQLPSAYNPNDGIVISANNRPTDLAVPVAFSYPSGTRFDRLKQLSQQQTTPINTAVLQSWQQDIVSEEHMDIRDHVVQLIANQPQLAKLRGRPVVKALQSWDGRFHVDSRSAYIVHLASWELWKLLATERFSNQKERTYWANSDHMATLLLEMLRDTTTVSSVVAGLPVILATLEQGYRDGTVWGDVHAIKFGHPLALVPLLGRGYRLPSIPIGGHTSTVAKFVNKAGDDAEPVRYGAGIRWLTDLATQDIQISMVGGNDGWVGSSQVTNMTSQWASGQYTTLPLRSPTASQMVRTIVQPIR